MIGADQTDVRATEVDDAVNRMLWLVCVLRHNAAVECLEARDRAARPKED